jgi:hypothetical protein
VEIEPPVSAAFSGPKMNKKLKKCKDFRYPVERKNTLLESKVKSTSVLIGCASINLAVSCNPCFPVVVG